MKRRPFARVPLPSPVNKSKKRASFGVNHGTTDSKASPECKIQVKELKDTIDVKKTENIDIDTKLQHKGDGDCTMSRKIPVCSNIVINDDDSKVEPAVNKTPVSEICDRTESKPVISDILPVDYSLRPRSSEPSECSRDSFMDSEHGVGTPATQIRGSTPRSSHPVPFDESSCSMDGHMIRMNLYGTDKDPSYQEEAPRPAMTARDVGSVDGGGKNLLEVLVEGQRQCLDQQQGHGRQVMVDHNARNITAEQLASEMVQKYGTANPQLITEMLTNGGGENYMCEGFDSHHQGPVPQYDGYQAHSLIDLLNTPPQLPPVECLSQHQDKHMGPAGFPRGLATPDSLRQPQMLSPQTFQGSVTYNDVHVHGGKWMSGRGEFQDMEAPCNGLKSDYGHMYPYDGHSNYPKAHKHQQVHRHQQQAHGHQQQVHGHQQVHEQAYTQSRPGDEGNDLYQNSKLWRPFTGTDQGHGGLRQQQYPSPGQQLPVGQYRSPQRTVNPGLDRRQEDSVGRLGLVSMTYTPRDMMEMHLNYNRSGQTTPSRPIQDTQYSTIYPRQSLMKQFPQPSHLHHSKVTPEEDSLPPKKRTRSSKYGGGPRRRDMPIFDQVMAKFPQPQQESDTFGSSHKYFVVNPSEVTSMSEKTLLNKYIDFLIVENEHITEISKSTAPPVDIYVTEDMYFMDSLKFSVPFPSKKFSDWVSSFYPKLNFQDMKFKGRQPNFKLAPRLLDQRPTQDILEDTFYFFQREFMNFCKAE